MQTKFLGSAGRFRQSLERVSRGLRQWRDDRRGAIAIQFAFLVVPVTVLAFGLVDLNRMNTQKYNLQDSLDAAALYAARSDADTDAELQAEGQKALMANLQMMDGAQLVSSSFELDGVTVIARAEMKLPAVVSNLWTNQDLTVRVNTEVMRNSKNVEVALVLDVTGSMEGQPIVDLRNAAAELVDIVVKEQQTPFYSKVAIVPYSMGVNVGEYADDVRGSIPAARGISSITWWKGSEKSLSKITRTNPAVVTSGGHGLSTGDVIYMWDVDSPLDDDLDNKAFSVTKIDNDKFSLNGVDATGGTSVPDSGKFRSCLTANCDLVVTSNNHGFATNAWVHLTDVSGGDALTSRVNNQTFQITKLSNDTFRLNGRQLRRDTSFTYTGNTGSAWCTTYGCEFYRFTNQNGGVKVHRVSTCVSERTGASPYTDNYPVSLNYPASGNPCLENTIYPLSSNKDALKAQIADLEEEGSTAGHIGVAWGWYMISPNFGSLWTNASSRPAAYTAPHTLKVVVWMTDGANNTAYCNGVIAQDSGTGSGSASDHINCNATNGKSSPQTLALCSAMKAQGIVVYTVGFNIAGNQPAIDVVNGCATDAEHVYLPNGGTALSAAFSAIGAEIDNLRLSK
ncbi:MAG TPA: pilus assembly protein TadG-related protein [Azospirillaceae bacterium]|nr:pilus assembly protein TadG-related protein [Azospirillaceae bacterium]